MDTNQAISVIFLTTAAILQGAFSTITLNGPDNVALLWNTEATLTCSVEQDGGLTEFISWEECITPDGGDCKRVSNDENLVYEALGGEPSRGGRYTIDHPASTKEYNFKVSSLKTGDAGKYRCLSRNDANSYRDAEIIVLERAPECSANISYDDVPDEDGVPSPVYAECSTSYTGRWAPVTEFTVDGDVVPGVVDTSTPDVAKYSIEFAVNSDYSRKMFEARTYFRAPSVQPKEAANTPAYENIHSFGNLPAAASGIHHSGFIIIASTVFIWNQVL